MNDKFDSIIEKARHDCIVRVSKTINGTKFPKVPRYIHIAFLMKGKRIVRRSFNDYNRQCVNGEVTTSLHAEVGCVMRLRNNDRIKKGFDILILRFNKNDGLLCDSKPCNNCKNFLLSKGINKVYCSTENGTIQKFKLSEIEEYYSIAWLKLKGLKQQ
jgi:deoxycytidylate deaminase